MSNSCKLVDVTRANRQIDWGMTYIADPVHNIYRISGIAPLSPIYKTKQIKVGAGIKAINGIVIRPGMSISEIINDTLRLQILVDNVFCAVPLIRVSQTPRNSSEVIDLLLNSDDSDNKSDSSQNFDNFSEEDDVLAQRVFDSLRGRGNPNLRVIMPQSNVLRPISQTGDVVTIDLVSSDDEAPPAKPVISYPSTVTKKRKVPDDVNINKKFGGKVVKKEYQINEVGFGEANFGDEVIEMLVKNETSNETADVEVIDRSETKKAKTNVKSDDNNINGDDDIEFLGGNMTVLADMAHQRESCSIKKFYASQNHPENAQYCNNCWCYVCDSLVQECTEWSRHCHAFSKSATWKEEKNSRKSFIKSLLDPTEFNKIFAMNRVAFMMNVDNLAFTNGFKVCTEAINYVVPLLPELVLPYPQISMNAILPALRVKIINALFLLNQANKAPIHIKQQSSFLKIPQYFVQLMLHPFVDNDIKAVFHKELGTECNFRYLDNSSHGFLLKFLRHIYTKDPTMKWNESDTCNISTLLKLYPAYWNEIRSHGNVLSNLISIFCSNRDLKALISLQEFDKSISYYIIFNALKIETSKVAGWISPQINPSSSTSADNNSFHKFEFIKQRIVAIRSNPAADWNTIIVPKETFVEVAKLKLIIEMVFTLQFLSKQPFVDSLKIIEMANIAFSQEMKFEQPLLYSDCTICANNAIKWTDMFSKTLNADWVYSRECEISTTDKNKIIPPILALYIHLHMTGNFDGLKNSLFMRAASSIGNIPLNFLILFMHAYLQLLSTVSNEISLDLCHKIAKSILTVSNTLSIATFELLPYSIIEKWSSMDDVYTIDNVDIDKNYALNFNECMIVMNFLAPLKPFLSEYYKTFVHPKTYSNISEWKVVLIVRLFWKTFLNELADKNITINARNRNLIFNFLIEGTNHLNLFFFCDSQERSFDTKLRSIDMLSVYDISFTILRILVEQMRQTSGLFIGPVAIWGDVIRSIKKICLANQNINIWKCWENILSNLVKLSTCTSSNENGNFGSVSIYDMIIGLSKPTSMAMNVYHSIVSHLIENISELTNYDIMSSSHNADFIISLLSKYCIENNEHIMKATKIFCSAQKSESTILYSLIVAKPTEVVNLLVRLMNPQIILILTELYKHRNFANRSIIDPPAPVIYFYTALGIDVAEFKFTAHCKALFTSFENTYESLYNNVKILSSKLGKWPKKSQVILSTDFGISNNLENFVLCLTYLELEANMTAILAKFYKRPSELATPKTDKRVVIPYNLVKSICEYAVNSHKLSIIELIMLYIADIYLVYGDCLEPLQSLISNNESSDIIVLELKVYQISDLISIEGFINNVNNDKVKINRVVQWIKDMYFLGKITLEVYLSIIIGYFSIDYLSDALYKFYITAPILQPESIVKILNYIILLLSKDELHDEQCSKIAILIGYINGQIINSKTNFSGLGIKEKLVLIYNQYVNPNNHFGASIAQKWIVPTILDGIMMSHENSMCFMQVMASPTTAHIDEAVNRNILSINLCALLIDQDNMTASVDVLWDVSKTIIMENLLLLCYDVSQSLILPYNLEQPNMAEDYSDKLLGHNRSGINGCAHIISVLNKISSKITLNELDIGEVLFTKLFNFGEGSADVTMTQFLILAVLSLNETIYLLECSTTFFENDIIIADKIIDMSNKINDSLISFTSYLQSVTNNDSFFVAVLNFNINPSIVSAIELQSETIKIELIKKNTTIGVSELLNKCIIMIFTNFDCSVNYTIHKFTQLCSILDLARNGKLNYFTILNENVTNLSLAVLRKPMNTEMMHNSNNVECTNIIVNNNKLLLRKSSSLFERIASDYDSKGIMKELCKLLDNQSAEYYIDVIINEYLSYIEGETLFTIDLTKELFTTDIKYATLQSKLERFGHGVGKYLIKKLQSINTNSRGIISNLLLLLYELSIAPTNENFVIFMSELIKLDSKSIYFYSNTIQKLLYFNGDGSSYNMWYNYAYYILFMNAQKQLLHPEELLLIISTDTRLLVNKRLIDGLVNYICNNKFYINEISNQICRNPPIPILSTVMQPDKKLVVGNVLWNLNKLALIPQIASIIWLTNINSAQEILNRFPSWIETIKRMISTVKYEFLKEEAYNLNVRVQSYIDNVVQLAYKVLRLLSSSTVTARMHGAIETFFYNLKVFLLKLSDSYLPEYALAHNLSLKDYATDKWVHFYSHCKTMCKSKKAILRLLVNADQLQS